MWAALWGDLELVRLFLVNGADINTQNNNGDTALSFAKQSGRPNVIDLLKAAGATE